MNGQRRLLHPCYRAIADQPDERVTHRRHREIDKFVGRVNLAKCAQLPAAHADLTGRGIVDLDPIGRLCLIIEDGHAVGCHELVDAQVGRQSTW